MTRKIVGVGHGVFDSTFPTAAVLGTISDLSATSGDATAALSWTAATNATSHQPQYSTDSGSTWTNFGSALGGTATSVTVTGLVNGTAYSFRVVASDGSTTTASNTATATPTAPAAPGTAFFTDSFESGDLLSTNTEGWGWGNTGDGSLGWNVSISDLRASSGTHAMQFTYPAKPAGEDATAEQRFVVAADVADAPTEVWIEYDWFVPANYKHRGGGAANNKFLTLWAENYSAANEAQFYLSLERESDSQSSLDIIAVHGDDVRYPGIRVSGSGFVTPADFGTWVNVKIHARLAVDGEIQVYKNGVLHVELTNFNMVREAYDWDYYRHGYLMGWSNSGYDVETIFYIDDFKFYTADPGWSVA